MKDERIGGDDRQECVDGEGGERVAPRRRSERAHRFHFETLIIPEKREVHERRPGVGIG
jgi:hypothetical protein